MPLFEYHCQDCGSEFELLIRSPKDEFCPHCQSKNITKGLSTFASAVSGADVSYRKTAMPDKPSSGHVHGPHCKH